MAIYLLDAGADPKVFEDEGAAHSSATGDPRLAVRVITCPNHNKYDWIGVARVGAIPSG